MITANKNKLSTEMLDQGKEKTKRQKSVFSEKLGPYWQRLSDREKMLLVIGGCFVALLILYLFLLEPLQNNLDVKVADVEQKQNDVLWMEQQLPLIQQLRQKNPVLIREDNRPLPALIEQTLGQFKLREVTDRIVPEENTVQIWMNRAPFEILLNWINSIGKFGVTVKKIDVTPHEDGLGNVNLTLILQK